jgi:hypothetical protein
MDDRSGRYRFVFEGLNLNYLSEQSDRSAENLLLRCSQRFGARASHLAIVRTGSTVSSVDPLGSGNTVQLAPSSEWIEEHFH